MTIAVPGLAVCRLPDSKHPTSPRRWRIEHVPSGLGVADAMLREDAEAGLVLLAGVTDWTQDADTIRASINPNDLYDRLGRVGLGCVAPGTGEAAGVNVAANGTYTDYDVAQAVAASGNLDSLQILARMAETPPWMGLDTEDFNEAHNLICILANAA